MIFAVAAILIAAAVVLPPSVSFDPCSGLLTWFSMTKGAAFNTLRTASPHNLALDTEQFVAA